MSDLQTKFQQLRTWRRALKDTLSQSDFENIDWLLTKGADLAQVVVMHEAEANQLEMAENRIKELEEAYDILEKEVKD